MSMCCTLCCVVLVIELTQKIPVINSCKKVSTFSDKIVYNRICISLGKKNRENVLLMYKF